MMKRVVSLAIASSLTMLTGFPVGAQAGIERELYEGRAEAIELAEVSPALNPEAEQQAVQEAAEDVPEEILRLEIITEARSPVDGRPLTAVEYAQLQAELRSQPDLQSDVSPELRNLIRLLYLRRAIRSIVPFLLN